jgi:hypothetical protein
MWIDKWIDLFQDKKQDDKRPDDGRRADNVREPHQGNGGDSRTPPRRRVAPGANLVAQTQIWGFSTTIAHQVVQGHPWRELVSGWRASTNALETERSPHRRLALVMLRAAILDEMEAQRPQSFASWFAEQQPARRRHPRLG